MRILKFFKPIIISNSQFPPIYKFQNKSKFLKAFNNDFEVVKITSIMFKITFEYIFNHSKSISYLVNFT